MALLGRNTMTWAAAAAAAAAAAVVGMAPNDAHACGGFFCNNSQPVNQAAERIVFSHGSDGTVTAVIQIQYQGPSEDFAWMLPVAGDPDVQVSSDAAFMRLQNATNPQYQLTTTIEGTCGSGGLRGVPGSASGGADAGASFDSDGGAPPVTVVNQGAVGPYDYVVISVDPAATDPADVAVTWLQDNGYDVSDFGREVLRPYLEGGMNLLSFRLSKGNDAGSIRPVMITFGSGLPSIPIRPTAVAATDDMGVMVWVLGAERAVPANYLSLELNEALINWLNPNSNYNDVVTRAANEAGGQGFVTEMAGPASPLADTIFSSWEQENWDRVSTSDWTGQEGTLLNDVVAQFATLDGMRDVIADTVPIPTGVTLEQLLACVSCYYDYSVSDIAGFEPAAFIAAMQSEVIEPMARTRALFEARPYMTRLYTTMSADEMTMDPVFDFNGDLGDYSNVHNAERIIECSPSLDMSEAPWRVELPNGETVRGSGTTWPFDTADEDMPANARTVRVGTSGTGEVVTDNTDAISETLDAHNATVEAGGSERDGGLCSASAVGTGSNAAALGLSLLALLGLALRRRRS